MAQESRIGQAIFGVTGIVVLSKLLGFAREMVIADRFGTSWEYDLLLLGMAAPVFINLVLVNSTNLLIVPSLTKIKTETDSVAYHRALWRIYSTLLVISFILTLAVMLLSPFLVRVIAPQIAPENYSQAELYCRLFALLIVLGFSESYLRSALNIEKNFLYPAAGTVVINIVAIAVIYFFSERLSVMAIVVGLLSGAFLQVLYLLRKLAGGKGVIRIKAEFFGENFRKIISVGFAVIAVEIFSRTYFLIDRYYASGMESGVVSALNYCSMLVMLPVNIIAFAVTAVTFPFLSERASGEAAASFSSLLKTTLRLLLALGIPCALFYGLFSRELVTAVFYRGAFDNQSLELTSRILVYLAPYLLSIFLYAVLIQACYASGRQKIVLVFAVAAMTLKFVLAGFLSDNLGLIGIPLSSSIVQAAMVAALIMVLVADRKIELDRSFGDVFFKTIVASLPIIMLAILYQQIFTGDDAGSILYRYRILPAILITIILYLIIGKALKLPETSKIWEMLLAVRKTR